MLFKKIVVIVILVLGVVYTSINAQQYSNIWMSGYEGFTPNSIFGGTVYKFGVDSLVLYKEDKEMNFDETVGIICDSFGLLQFYSNGLYVANINNDTMVNGGDINPGWASDFWSSQMFTGCRFLDGMIVLPDNIDPAIFHLFQLNITETEFDPNALVPNAIIYSKIDMKEDSGLGAVINKQKIVYQSPTNRLSDNHFNAVRHANGVDWWLIVFEHETSSIITLLFTNDTVIIVNKYQQELPFISVLGQCEFSLDGSKFASGHIISENGSITSRFQYYLFDRCSGFFTPLFTDIRTNTSSEIDGVSFSASGRYLFEFYHTYIFRYDTEAADIFASKDTIAEWDGFTWYTTGGIGAKVRFGYGELGPDENIYCFSSSAVPYFHRINYPDDPKLTTVDQHILLPTINSRTVPHFPNYKLGPLVGSPCVEMFVPPDAVFDKLINEKQVSFTDQSTGVPLTWHWNFGDAKASDEQHPVHVYEEEGVYNVCLTVGNVFGSDTACQDIEVSTTGIIMQGDELVSVSINPNPVSGWLTVKVPGHSGIVRILDATGRILFEHGLLSGIAKVNTVDLPAGLAFVQYVDEQGWISWSKVMILH